METTTNEPIHHDGTTKSGTGRFGKLGLDVGLFGRWSRLLWGVTILVPVVVGAVRDTQGSGSSLSFYGLAGVYFLGIAAVYVLVYRAFGPSWPRRSAAPAR